MPTYDYICRSCNHRFDMFQPITDQPVSVCPNCGGGQVERLISPGAGFLFKGSGFYTTDYRKDSYKKDARKEAPASGKSDSQSSPKPDSTSTSKPDAGKPSSTGD